MATEQLHVIVGIVGEWYWGAECPQCGAITPHRHDPARGQGDSEKPGEGRVAMTCPNGHQFDAATENVPRFEWGAQ